MSQGSAKKAGALLLLYFKIVFQAVLRGPGPLLDNQASESMQGLGLNGLRMQCSSSLESWGYPDIIQGYPQWVLGDSRYVPSNAWESDGG